MLYFLHMPKTAGTSLVHGLEKGLPEGSLLRLYGRSKDRAEIRRYVQGLSPSEREKLRVVAGHQVWYGIHRIFNDPEPRYITFLRTPVSRVVSNYYKILRTPEHALHPLLQEEEISLHDFVRRGVSPHLCNHQTALLAREEPDGNHNAELCVEWDEQLFNRAVNRLKSFAYVGTKETWNQDREHLSESLGVPIPEEQVHRPPGDPNNMMAELEPNLIAEIAQHNRMDTALYDYAAILRERKLARAPISVPLLAP